MQYLSENNFFKLLDALRDDYEVYVPSKKGETRSYKKYTEPTEDIVIGEVRPFEPLKAFFAMAREVVAEDFKNTVPHMCDIPLAIVGVKNCDLKQGFQVQDNVFKDHDYKDPFYIKNREQNLIISADCTCAIDTCYCVAQGNKTYPETNFDINLSQVEGGFIVETGSEKGKKIVAKHASLFQQADEKHQKERKSQRGRVEREVEKNIKDNNIPRNTEFEGIIEKNFDSHIWEEEAKECVECGACTNICPTCHCFLLYDQKDENKMGLLHA